MSNATGQANDGYPHEGGCSDCRAERLCNYCGADIRHDHGHCTNGRCSPCHATVCTPGGGQNPGHGYGEVSRP